MSQIKQPIIHAGISRSASTTLLTHVFPKLKTYQLCDYEDYLDLGQLYLEDINPASPVLKLNQANNLLLSNKSYLRYDVPLAWRKYGMRLRTDIFISNITALFKDRGKLFFVIRRQDSLIESYLRNESCFRGENYFFVDYPVTNSVLDKGSYQIGDKTLDFDVKIYKKADLINRFGMTYTHTFDYFDIFKRLAAKIDKKRICILLYEDFVNDKKKFFAQMSEFFEEDLSSYAAMELDHIHKSLNQPDIHQPWLRSLVVSPKFSNLRRLIPWPLKKLLRSSFSGQLSVSDKFRKNIMALYKENNQRFAREFNLDLEKYNYC